MLVHSYELLVLYLMKLKNKYLIALGCVISIASLLLIPNLYKNNNTSNVNTQAASNIVFPKDHGQHPRFNAEWWYINIIVRSVNNNGTDIKEHAYVLSFSRVSNNVNMLTSRFDNSNKEFQEASYSNGSLTVNVGEKEAYSIKYSKGNTSGVLQAMPMSNSGIQKFNLSVESTVVGQLHFQLSPKLLEFGSSSAPLLWGNNCSGKITVFTPNDTFYYSIPNLDVSGSFTDTNGKQRTIVSGKAWIDHQWFNSVPPQSWKGHYWSNMHLTSGDFFNSQSKHTAIGYVNQMSTNGPVNTYWVKRNPDGTSECGTSGTFTPVVYTPTRYPKTWKISSPSFTLSGSTLSNNQIYNPLVGPQFTEALSEYSGTISGKSISGFGFVETHIKK